MVILMAFHDRNPLGIFSFLLPDTRKFIDRLARFRYFQILTANLLILGNRVQGQLFHLLQQLQIHLRLIHPLFLHLLGTWNFRMVPSRTPS